MENMSQSGFLIKRAHEGASVWTFSFSDIFEKFYKYLINKCLWWFRTILKMSVLSYFLAFFQIISKTSTFWRNLP